MTNQEVFEMLSENEARLFYAYCDDRDNEALKAAHESVKYDRKDFFNHRIYTEDKKDSYTREDLRKVFAYFSKNHDSSIQIDSVVIYWDSLTEYENRVVTVRDYDGRNYDETKKSFDKAKKECYLTADGN